MVFAERGAQEERQHSRTANDPPVDTWDTGALTVGGGFRRGFGARLEVVLDGRYTVLDGEATRADLSGMTTFESDEAAGEAAAEVRVAATPAVDIVARLSTRYEDRTRADRLEDVGTESTTWVTGVGAAVAWRARSGLDVWTGIGTILDRSGGTMPDPNEIGVAFIRYVAPELALGLSDANGLAAAAGLLWDGLPSAAVLRVRGAWHALAVVEERSLGGYQPEGERSGWSLEVGVVQRR